MYLQRAFNDMRDSFTNRLAYCNRFMHSRQIEGENLWSPMKAQTMSKTNNNNFIYQKLHSPHEETVRHNIAGDAHKEQHHQVANIGWSEYWMGLVPQQFQHS